MAMRGKYKPLYLWAAVLLMISACSVASGFGVGTGGVPKGALCPGHKAVGKVTVVNWWEPIAAPGLLKSAQDFNCDHPDIAINISVNSSVGDDSNGKLLAAVAAHKPPDVVMSWDDVLAGWATKGEIRPLDTPATANGVNKADFIGAAWKSAQWNGKLYGIPVDWDPDAMLWYNKKLFKAAGLDPNRPPRTWAELQKDAAKIDLVQHGKIKRIGFVPWAGWQFNYIQLGHQFGATFADGATQRVVLDSPGLRKTFAYERQVAAKFGGAAKVNSFTTVTGAQGAASDPLISGRLGMELIGDWELGQQVNVGKKAFRDTVGVTEMPTPPGGQQYLCHSGWSFMVPTGAKHAAAAVKFAAWMNQGDHFAKYLGSVIGWLPAKTSTLSQPYITSDPTWRAIVALDKKIGRDWWLSPSPIMQQYYRTLDETQASLIALQKMPKQAATQAQRQVQAVLNNAVALGVYE
jgi:multiple sugar transport system substrate-binding protein